MHAKDLPEHGLIIIRPTDPEFDTLAAASLRGAKQNELDAIKPVSAIVKNGGGKYVVAHAFIWDCVKTNGEKKSYRIDYANSEFFTEGAVSNQSLANTNLDKTIKPGSALLITLVPLHQGPRSSGGGSGSRQSNVGSINQLNGVDEERNRQQDLGTQILTTYMDITVSIDGVFFADGTFVGPDTSGFYDKMKTQVSAKLDLLKIIAENSKLKKSEDEMFRAIQAKADMAVKTPTANSPLTEYYDFMSKFFAARLLLQKRVYGSEKMVEIALRSSNNPPPPLRKVNALEQK